MKDFKFLLGTVDKILAGLVDQRRIAKEFNSAAEYILLFLH
ncbi:hypothetical protein BACCIP111883_04587 [Sutcliffiella rhizosphaerae]|uniref:Transposase n=1 Tax=Sutcliffiella rhizosphaerae TaxID=2880967 RepID=A0ABM8YUW1_9BACI|nr:hypothetical protein BACCIP111883_04587 [Sutcliffiella rhizosphaerae]